MPLNRMFWLDHQTFTMKRITACKEISGGDMSSNLIRSTNRRDVTRYPVSVNTCEDYSRISFLIRAVIGIDPRGRNCVKRFDI